ncbi:Hcp1 family type VI secretion system effector [Pseudomonas sp. M47T1]|uniref:Hcp family type VI secretion system effector n=1 Tax=Pseudomonas sp. M47T1 TaxID=1179778 RepID=UPI0002606BC9|nr:type VI secretion system tube protein Hcp [Pseudomonas sp. M47T1]EIK95112.1 Hcp1 family type VI secretion system effector [Pseudomonas sp. M47T1]
MAFDAYINIDGIPGESLDASHQDWIEITSYQFGSHQRTSATASSAGGATSGRPTLTDFSFTKVLDKASAKLFEANCAGTHIPKVVVELHRAGGDKLKYMEIQLEEVMVSDYTQSGAQGEPLEIVQLNFGRIKTVYTLQTRSDGGAGGSVLGGWDRIANKIFA